MQVGVSRAAEPWSGRSLLEQGVVWSLTLLALLLLSLPVFQAERSRLTSDESLYLAEGLNISAGQGLTYTTGEAITHRPPLYPALLAGALRLTGGALDDVYWLPRLVMVANVLLALFLARHLFGPWAGVVAGGLTAISPYLRGLGTTLFLDGTQTAFLLGSLLLLSIGQQQSRAAHFLASGCLLGAAFLVKESAVLLLPLPLVLTFFYGLDAGWKRRLIAFYAGFASLTAWWWAWVYVETGRLFLVGDPASHLGLLVIAGATVALAAALLFLRVGPDEASASRVSRAAALTLVLAWGATFLLGLEMTGWDYDSDYARHVPQYLSDVVASNVQPALLVLVAWVLAFAAAWRGRREWGILAASMLLFASFALLVADRGLSLRDILPLVYLSYVALGGVAAALVAWGATFDRGARLPIFRAGGVLAGAIVLVALLADSGGAVTQRATAAYQDDWQNPLVQDAAAWLEQNVEPGSVLMSSRLYYSHLYFLTDGAFEVHQLPTVEARLDLDAEGSPPLHRRSTLFRWEDHLLPSDSTADRWLYLTRYPVKGYLIALAENDLLDEIGRRDVDFMVITSRDAGFSSPALFQYFDDNPAFSEVFAVDADSDNAIRVYAVHPEELAPRDAPALVTSSAYDEVREHLGAPEADAVLGRLNPSGFRVTPY